VTSLMVDHIGVPSGMRDSRALELTHRRALDGLAGRTVWCAAALPGGRAAAEALRTHLRGDGDDVDAGSLEIAVGGPLRQLAEQLESMLAGAPARESLGPAEQEIFAEGALAGETLVGRGVGHDDVVVLHDALTAMLAQAIRERGAHVVWQVQAGGAPGRAAAGTAAWTFLRRYTPGVDAYLMTWLEPQRGGVLAESIAALMPSADVVATKEVTAGGGSDRRHNLAWSSMLADVVDADRGESVGGTLHPRPAVAAR
jgi:hypothetical protein